MQFSIPRVPHTHALQAIGQSLGRASDRRRGRKRIAQAGGRTRLVGHDFRAGTLPGAELARRAFRTAFISMPTSAQGFLAGATDRIPESIRR